MKNCVYDDFTDRFLVSNKKKNDKVMGSVVIGDFVIDLTKEGKVAGLEIKHFSKWLKQSQIDAEISEIVDAKISVNYKSDSLIIVLFIKFDEIEKRIPIHILTETAHFAKPIAAIA